MALIDIHPHVIATDTQRFPLAPIGGRQSDWSQERPVTYEQMIEAMDQAGIAKSVVVQASSAYAYDNSYVAAAVAAYPKRFTGVFSVDALAPDAVDKMKYWMAKGLTGMRLYTAGSTMEQKLWFTDPKTFPAWTFAGEAGLPVCMQMRFKAFPQLKEMLERFPKVRFIIDHLGRTEMADGPPYAAAAPLFELGQRYPQRLPQGDAPQFRGVAQRQRDSGNVLPAARRGLRRRPHRLGLEFSGRKRAAAVRAGRARARYASPSCRRPIVIGSSRRRR